MYYVAIQHSPWLRGSVDRYRFLAFFGATKKPVNIIIYLRFRKKKSEKHTWQMIRERINLLNYCG